MKYLFILIPLLIAPLANAVEYRTEFYQQLNKNDFPKMEKTLKDWKSSDPNGAELLMAYGNFYCHKAQSQKGTTPGKPFDSNSLLQAAVYWKEAVRRYPWRLDIRFELARLYQDMGDFEAQYSALAQALQYADRHKKNIRWINNEDLPEQRSKFIPEALQDFTAHYMEGSGPENSENAFRLAKLTMTYYPRHPYAYNSIAAYYSLRQDWEHTLKYLLIAQQKDPRDSLVLRNIGSILARLDKPEEAKIYYEKVVDLNNNEEYVDEAKKQIALLGASK